MDLQYLYYFVLLLATIGSFLTRTSVPGLRILRVLLVAGVIAELLFNIFFDSRISPFWVYNIYIPIECLLLVMFYGQVRPARAYQQLAKVFLVLYFSFVAIYFLQSPMRFFQMPSLIYNLSVIIQVVLATIALVFIEPRDDTSILRLPEFWILSAIIIFYSGVFVFNGIGVHSDAETYQYLHSLIVKSLNILFYVTLILVFSWKQRIKK